LAIAVTTLCLQLLTEALQPVLHARLSTLFAARARALHPIP
jgi:hypothetical protein